jgi:hypothetical protein
MDPASITVLPLAVVVTAQPICDGPCAAAHVAKQELSAVIFATSTVICARAVEIPRTEIEASKMHADFMTFPR